MPKMFALDSYTPKFFVISLEKGMEKVYVQGITRTVSLTDEAGREVFKRTFSYRSEFRDFINKYIISYPGYSAGLALLVLPRTESWGKFAQALLFPTVINHALRQSGILQRTAGTVAGLAIDLFTLFPRVLASSLQIRQNRSEFQHPLFELLKGNPEASLALEKGHIMAHVRTKAITIDDGKCRELGGVHFTAKVDTVKVSKLILANPHIPCPIQALTNTTKKSRFFKGSLRLSSGYTFLTHNPIKMDLQCTPTFHFFSGLSKEAIRYEAYFPED